MLKSSADRYDITAGDGEVSKIFDARGLFDYANQNLCHPKQNLYEKKGKGVYKRVFFYIPITGEDSVNRRNNIQCKTFTGIKSLHQFIDIGKRGKIAVRTGSCLTCDFCKVHDYFRCTNTSHVDQLEERDVQLQTPSHAPITRAQLRKKAVDIADTGLPGDFVAAEVLDNVDFSFYLFMVPQSYEGPQTINGKQVLLLQQLFPVEAGSHVYNVGENTTAVDPSCLIAGKVAMEGVIDCRMMTRRAAPLPARYRLDGDDLHRIVRNVGIPDEHFT